MTIHINHATQDAELSNSTHCLIKPQWRTRQAQRWRRTKGLKRGPVYHGSQEGKRTCISWKAVEGPGDLFLQEVAFGMGFKRWVVFLQAQMGRGVFQQMETVRFKAWGLEYEVCTEEQQQVQFRQSTKCLLKRTGGWNGRPAWVRGRGVQAPSWGVQSCRSITGAHLKREEPKILWESEETDKTWADGNFRHLGTRRGLE